MAASVTVTRSLLNFGKDGIVPVAEVVSIAWVADSSGAASASITLAGFVLKAVTKPGSPAPTDNYDITLGDPIDSTFDALDSSLLNRDTANTEQTVVKLTNGVSPIFLAGSYTFTIANAGSGGAGTCVLYLVA